METDDEGELDARQQYGVEVSENDRAAVRHNGFGPPARLRSVFIGGDLSTFSATDSEGNGMEASVDPQPWGPDWMPITPERGPCCMPKLR